MVHHVVVEELIIRVFQLTLYIVDRFLKEMTLARSRILLVLVLDALAPLRILSLLL